LKSERDSFKEKFEGLEQKLNGWDGQVDGLKEDAVKWKSKLDIVNRFRGGYRTQEVVGS
jgi:hypothetical protein